MNSSSILDRASKLTKFSNAVIEVNKFNYEASLIVKNMGDAFVIKFADNANRVILDSRGSTKEKDFLYALQESSDVLVYTKDVAEYEMENKKIVLFNNIDDFERISYAFKQNQIILFVLSTSDESVLGYYPVIKFEESKIYGKKFFFDATKA